MLVQTQWSQLIGKLWGNCFWVKSKEDVDMVANELKTTFGRTVPSNDELCDVLRYMAGTGFRQEKCPSLRELIRGICIYRKRQREELAGISGGNTPEARIALAKTRMQATENWLKRWDVMCDTCKTREECESVDAWAETRWREWQFERERVRRGIAVQLHKCVLQLSGKKVVDKEPNDGISYAHDKKKEY